MLDKNGSNVFDYIQTSLRSASDIYKHGGHVIQKYRDRKFSIEYDNKRRILDNLKREGLVDPESGLLDSVP